MENAEEHYGNDKDSLDFYSLKPFTSTFSQGVYDLAEGCDCLCFIEKVFIHQSIEIISAEAFQCWQLQHRTQQ